MELEVTWGRAIKVWWAYAWRNFLAIIACLIAATILGFIAGLVMGAAGAAPSTIKVVTFPLGFITGVAFSIIPMKLILGKNFGEFKLALVKAQ
jgi:hypothetical protein